MQTPGSLKLERHPFQELGNFSPLFTDYLAFAPEIASFFEGDFRHTASFDRAAQQTLEVRRDRDTLADVLLDQNTRWGLDEQTRSQIERLRQPDSVAVVTGQQLGLFLSPLYIPYKTLTTLRLAQHLEQELNRPVVPIFWLASEDHDFAEVASFTLLDGQQPVKLTYPSESDHAGKGPVGRLPLSTHIERLIQQIHAVLPQTENSADLQDALLTHFRPGVSFTDAFAPFLKRIYQKSGLILVDIDDVRLKRLCAPIIGKEISTSAELTSRLVATTEHLKERYHAQVALSPTNFFLMDDHIRQPIDLSENSYTLRDRSQGFTINDLQQIVERSPMRFSPNVILRPIVQDVLFPTISYVGGPGEIAYYAQAKPAYAWAELPMPVIYPRASLTLVEPGIEKMLQRYQWHVLTVNRDPELLFQDFARASLPFDIDALSMQASQEIAHALLPLKNAAVSLEASLGNTAGSTEAGIQKHLDRLITRTVRAQKRRQLEDRQRIFKVQAHLFPNGKLQERELSPLYYLNRYGLDFFTSLMKEISIDTTQHQIVRL